MARGNKTPIVPFLVFVVVVIVAAIYAFYNYAPTANSNLITAENTINTTDLKTTIEKIIEENPEMLVKSLEKFQIKKMKELETKSKEVLHAKQDELKNSPSPYIGNKNADIVITEFFDYNCGYCKKVNTIIEQLVEKDKNVKVILKEMPILNENSLKAAQAALAIYAQDPEKFIAFHNALMQTSGINETTIREIGESLSIDMKKIMEFMKDASIEKELAQINELAKEIAIHGTPAFIIEDELIPGAVDLSILEKKIADIRAKAKK